MFVAWRDMRFARGRFTLMTLVVVLLMLLVGLISGLTEGLARSSTSAVTGLPVDHLTLAAPSDGEDAAFERSMLSREQAHEWSRATGVERAAPFGVGTARAELDGHAARISVFGVAASGEPGGSLIPGGQPVARGAAVLSTGAAEELDAGPGDVLTLPGHSLRVRAVAGTDSYSHAPVVWLALPDWRELAGGAQGAGYATALALDTTADADLAATDARLGTTTIARDDARHAVSSFDAENSSLQAMRGLLLAISALVTGAFFAVWTIQRSTDIAVLKALGAATGYLVRDALAQACAVLVAGIAAGSALAVATGAAVSGVVPFALDAGTLLAPATAMLVLGLLGASLAVRRVTAIDPLTALGSAR
ncbi:ABC transporter permease [Haloechinothrix sp. LS1_15]|uniref:ABC transporter permease n=1 Tax=Haloechinothrix sp. LS1_15 TaxID=2652248 RepID=UPI002947C01B|nr:ABC transporter permease [Haloechinothrix sp. LS1_15]MDV6012546.1 ABC transporter permease [Haloechinothrix sp. LS1_15]